MSYSPHLPSCVQIYQNHKQWLDVYFVNLTRSNFLPKRFQISVLHEEVEHDDLVIDNMIHSSKTMFFLPELEKMKEVLAEITTILKTWIATQENCLILARFEKYQNKLKIIMEILTGIPMVQSQTD